VTGEFAVAVHALVYLDMRAEVVDSEALAKNICTNPARVRKVMAKLRHAGLVDARPGAEGGYRTVRDARSVTLRQVAEALGEHPVSAAWRSGDPEMRCMVSSGMARAMDGVYEAMGDACMERLSRISISDVEARLAPRSACGLLKTE